MGRTRIAALTALVMAAFAANSVLNRAALAEGEIGAMAFAVLRLVSGAVVLAALATWRGGPGWLGRIRPMGVLALFVYIVGFSLAYLALDAGAGALILFGGVQLTMFAGALAGDEAVPARRWIGTGVALAGLCWMLWPAGTAAVSPLHAALMCAAALGWGVYSLLGRGVRDPLGATAGNFAAAAVLATAVAALGTGIGGAPSARGVTLALISGVVTSGLGYALWYTVLPRLAASTAALSQLSVPVIAVAAGAALLAEPVTLRLVLSCLLVVGGVALGVSAARR